MKGRGKGDENSSAPKPQAAKFLAKPKTVNHSTATASIGSFRAEYIPELSSINDPDTQVTILPRQLIGFRQRRRSSVYATPTRTRLPVRPMLTSYVLFVQAEIRRILSELEQLRERATRTGNAQFAARLAAMSQAARQIASPVTAIDVVDAVASNAAARLENGPSGAIKETDNDLRQRKSSHSTKEKNKSPKNSPDSGTLRFTEKKISLRPLTRLFRVLAGLGGLMFTAGPVVNNVLACMTDKIVCATFSADPSLVAGENAEEPASTSSSPKHSSIEPRTGSPGLAPVSSLALAAAPLLTSNFAFDTRGVTVLRNYSAPNSRRSSELQDVASSESAQLSLVGDHANSGALVFGPQSASLSVQSLCQLSCVDPVSERRQSEAGVALSSRNIKNNVHHRICQFSPKVRRRADGSPVNGATDFELRVADTPLPLDSSVRGAPVSDSVSVRSLSRSRINTDDRECFTDEVTV